MKYKAVIFDLFGTLVDIDDPAAYASALRETSSILKIPHEEFLKVWKETSARRITGGFKTLEENLEYICRELGLPVKPFDINLAKMVRYDYLALALTPRLFAVETLTELKKEGYKLALLSNCSMDIPVLWSHIAIAQFFETVIFSSACGLQKPDPQIYNMVIEKLRVKPEECLFIDDSIVNLKAAAGVGIEAVLIRVPEEEEAHIKPPAAKPTAEWNGPVITSLPEVLDVLEGVHEN